MRLWFLLLSVDERGFGETFQTGYVRSNVLRS
ncbi:hypothetical protein Ae168Ps1_0652c [Pseudonocardia sp. Ae168_Ps1]|nr:hypothetical protein Ae168Ps1_0652c [Pseudonocardia sp. Ae168_Ps1]